MMWLLLAVGCGCALLGYWLGSTVGDVCDDDESLVAAFFADLAVTECELEEERERADEMAEALRDMLYGGDFLGAQRSVDEAVLALRAHDGARAHR